MDTKRTARRVAAGGGGGIVSGARRASGYGDSDECRPWRTEKHELTRRLAGFAPRLHHKAVCHRDAHDAVDALGLGRGQILGPAGQVALCAPKGERA